MCCKMLKYIENAKVNFLARYLQAGSLAKFGTDCVKNKIDNLKHEKVQNNVASDLLYSQNKNKLKV